MTVDQLHDTACGCSRQSCALHLWAAVRCSACTSGGHVFCSADVHAWGASTVMAVVDLPVLQGTVWVVVLFGHILALWATLASLLLTSPQLGAWDGQDNPACKQRC